jgi:LPXTG-motif cell wall-anchored protein
MSLFRNMCVIVATLGFMTVISPILWPETTSPGFTVLGVVMLLGGAGVFVLLGKSER